jgi:hypothetical protein
MLRWRQRPEEGRRRFSTNWGRQGCGRLGQRKLRGSWPRWSTRRPWRGAAAATVAGAIPAAIDEASRPGRSARTQRSCMQEELGCGGKTTAITTGERSCASGSGKERKGENGAGSRFQTLLAPTRTCHRDSYVPERKSGENDHGGVDGKQLRGCCSRCYCSD